MKKQKPLTIGVVIEHSWEIDVGYLSRLLEGIYAEAELHNLQIIRITSGFLNHTLLDNHDSQRNILLSICGPESLDGLLLSGTTGHFLDEKGMKSIQPFLKKIPTVGIGPIPSLICAEVDNSTGMIEAMEHLIVDHGFRDIAFIRGPRYSEEAELRFHLYKKMLSHFYIPYREELVTQGDYFVPSGEKSVHTLIEERKVYFQAILSANDSMAIGAINELHKMGIQVPYDKAVIGYDDIKQAEHTVPTLTTVHQPLMKMGRNALRLLLQILDPDQQNPQKNKFLPTYLKIRRSCGCRSMSYLDTPSNLDTSTGQKIDQAINVDRSRIELELKDHSSLLNEIYPQWEIEYLECFIAAMETSENDRFLDIQDILLRKLHMYGLNALPIHKAISTLQLKMLPQMKDSRFRRYGEFLLQKAQLLICQESTNTQALESFSQAQKNVMLHDIGHRLMTNFDLKCLVQNIAEDLPKLGIPGAYLVFYENPSSYKLPDEPPPFSRLILAFNQKNGVIHLDTEGRRFPTKQILPPDIFAQTKDHFLMMESLFFREEQLGYIIFERGPKQRLFYEVLRGKISSAVKGALLLEARKKNEEELTLGRDNLDKKVQERTLALKKLNKGLKQEIKERKKAQKEISTLKNDLSSIINSMPSFLVSVSPEGKILQWNREAEKRTGTSAEEALGKGLSELIPELAEEEKLILSRKSSENYRIRNHRYLDSQGNEVFEEITLYPLQEKNREGAVIRIDNVTQRVRIEEMMIQSEKMLSLGGLAAGMAHEINNPLAGMMQTSEVMKRRLSEDLPGNLKAAEEIGIQMEQIRQFMERRDIPKMLRRIHESGSRAAEIVDNMLSFARKDNTSKSTVNIVELLDKTLELARTDYNLKKRYDFKKINIQKEYDSRVPPVLCEFGKIQQVILNLLKNGAEAMHEIEEKDAPKPVFVLRTYPDKNGKWVIIEIEDNGPGIPEDIKHRIFDPFFTTKSSSKGTGLGLSVSYFIVTQNHQGTLEVLPAPERGSLFRIKLPQRSTNT